MRGAELLLIQILTFFAVATIAFGAERWLSTALTIRRRLGGPAAADRRREGGVVKDLVTRNRFLAWVEGAALKDGEESTRLRRDLNEAGYESPLAPIYFVVIRFTLAVGLPLAFIAAQQFAAKPATGFGLILFSMVLASLGLFGPGVLLNRRIQDRRTQLEDEFPDALDLMVVCVEAGLSLEAAFVRVSQEIESSRPMIADALQRVTEEWQAGRARSDALRAMASRVNAESVRAFAALLIQTDTLGTSIAQTLRTFSTEMRQTRFLKAEEKAMRIPVLMTVPLVACILPVIITALMLPAAIDVIRTLAPLLRGEGG
jgi:tight adherence protein C